MMHGYRLQSAIQPNHARLLKWCFMIPIYYLLASSSFINVEFPSWPMQSNGLSMPCNDLCKRTLTIFNSFRKSRNRLSICEPSVRYAHWSDSLIVPFIFQIDHLVQKVWENKLVIEIIKSFFMLYRQIFNDSDSVKIDIYEENGNDREREREIEVILYLCIQYIYIQISSCSKSNSISFN